jgi:single-strand DNA-binding protein
MSLNKVIMQGRLVADPELRTTNSGVSVANWRIAVDRNYKDASGERGTDFIRCTAWRGTADFVTKWFHKGSMILLEGSLQNSEFTDKDGNNRTVAQVVVDNVFFAGSKSENGGDHRSDGGGETRAYDATATKPDAFQEITDGSEDELPF